MKWFVYRLNHKNKILLTLKKNNYERQKKNPIKRLYHKSPDIEESMYSLIVDVCKEDSVSPKHIFSFFWLLSLS